MGRLFSTACGVLLTAALGWGVPGQELPRVWKTYGKNIEYQDLSKINFSLLLKKEIPVLPKELEEKLKDRQRYSFRVEDQELLEELILNEVEKLGVRKTEIAELQPKKAIMLAMDVAASVFDYFYVDENEAFLAKHGKNLPIEKYMQLGKGDCDKYTDVAVLAFNLFKEKNQNLKNIYLLNDAKGPESYSHVWVTVFILDNNKIITTSLDPTYYDGGKLEGKRGTHIPENNLERLADFYYLLENRKVGYLLIEEALQDNTLEEETKDDLLYKLFFSAFQFKDWEKIESARERYMKLERKRHLDDVLYWSYDFEKEEGNSIAAEVYKSWLLTDFPDSHWTKKLINQQ